MNRALAGFALALALAGCGSADGEAARLAPAAHITRTTGLRPATGRTAAHASPTLVTDSYELGSLQGPDLAIDGPATLIGVVEGSGPKVVRSFASGSSQPVARVGFPNETGSMLFSASPTRIAALVTEPHRHGNIEETIRVLESGMLGGPLRPLPAECPSAQSIDEFVPTHTNVAVDGEVVSYDTYRCVIVHDFLSGVTRVIPLEVPYEFIEGGSLESGYVHSPLQIAGRFVAYRSTPAGGNGAAAVVVYDIDSGREAYRVPLPATPLRRQTPWNGPTFGLQADGTVVISNPWTCATTVSTLASPSPSPLGIPACAVGRVVDGRALVVIPGAGKDRALAWTALSAPSAHPIADLGPEDIFEATPPTMDEDSVVYALTSCTDQPDIYRAPLAEPGTPPAPPAKCPVRLVGRHATVGASTLRVKFTCPSGCEGKLTAYIGTTSQLRRGRGEFIYGEGPVLTARPGRSLTVTLLGPEEGGAEGRLIRRLRSDHRLRVELLLRLDSPTEQLAYDMKGPETRIVAPISVAAAPRGRRRSR